MTIENVDSRSKTTVSRRHAAVGGSKIKDRILFRVKPMLATLVDAPFARPNWIFEEKYDGVRILAYKEGGKVSLVSRNAIDRTEHYPEIVRMVQKLKAVTLLLDGEVAVFDRGGISRFQLLQQSKGQTEYAVFDCLYHDGTDLRREPLVNRRKILQSIVAVEGRLRVSTVVSTDGLKAFRIAGQRGFEGVVGKNLSAVYESRRSREWLKVKVHREQEFVIGGFTEPKGSRVEFGALLLGVYDKGVLRYVGKVGTGFDSQILRDLRERFQPLIRQKSTFHERLNERDVTFLKPELVAQISFTEWTADGKLRHPVYLGLRDDKSAREVRRED
jgi:bifunctional non-homologous end joining protein LigD